MNMMEADQLTRIYNTLMLIKTSGQDTKIMGKCLENFEAFLSQAIITEDNDMKQNEEG